MSKNDWSGGHRSIKISFKQIMNNYNHNYKLIWTFSRLESACMRNIIALMISFGTVLLIVVWKLYEYENSVYELKTTLSNVELNNIIIYETKKYIYFGWVLKTFLQIILLLSTYSFIYKVVALNTDLKILTYLSILYELYVVYLYCRYSNWLLWAYYIYSVKVYLLTR